MVKCLSLSCLLLSLVATMPAYSYDKVVIFGDSYSDLGNNRSDLSGCTNCTDKAPVTNQLSDGGAGYTTGQTWVVPFVDDLNVGSQTVKVSRAFDDGDPVSATDSVDFAYSGDKSGGLNYDNTTKQYVVGYHDFSEQNEDCSTTVAAGANGYCGGRNRAYSFASSPPMTVTAQTLYVIWLGGNDLKALIPALTNEIGAGDRILPNPDFDKPDKNDSLQLAMYDMLRQTESDVESMITKLTVTRGAKHFLIVGLPNVGDTPSGDAVIKVYGLLHPSTPNDVMELLTNLTNKYYSDMETFSAAYASRKGINIRTADVNALFDMMRAGELGAFPNTTAAINQDPVKGWLSNCCTGTNNTYNPAACSTNASCSGASTQLPASAGFYFFYNSLHPSVCAHRYIAKYLASKVDQNPVTFTPSADLCGDL